MKNVLLVKFQTNVNQRKHISKVSDTNKSRILTIKIGAIVLCKNLFFFPRLNRFLYFWVLKMPIFSL